MWTRAPSSLAVAPARLASAVFLPIPGRHDYEREPRPRGASAAASVGGERGGSRADRGRTSAVVIPAYAEHHYPHCRLLGRFGACVTVASGASSTPTAPRPGGSQPSWRIARGAHIGLCGSQGIEVKRDARSPGTRRHSRRRIDGARQEKRTIKWENICMLGADHAPEVLRRLTRAP